MKLSEKITEKLFGEKGASAKGTQMASNVGKSIRGGLTEKEQDPTLTKTEEKNARTDTKDPDSTALIESAPSTTNTSKGIEAAGKPAAGAASPPPNPATTVRK